jgi:twitching motility two-component system response regulator PilG
MTALPKILLIDNNPVSEKTIEKALAQTADVMLATNVQQAAEILHSERITLIMINADTYSINAATTCAWLKGEPSSSGLKLVVITQNIDPQKELKYFHSGACDVLKLPMPFELLNLKILQHIASPPQDAMLQQATTALNLFYEQTYRSDSVSQCLSIGLEALQTMNLNGALHICDHPELTCSSYGLVSDYEKNLLIHAQEICPAERSARLTLGDEHLSILIQDLPNTDHPHYQSLTDWVNKLFTALSYKIKTLLAPLKPQTDDSEALTEDTSIPKTAKGAQRLHYYVERALGQMETSCEQEINRSLGRIDELTTWPLTPAQKRHIVQLKDNVLQLKETLLTNCLEIESRYLQFITERRAITRLNLGW